MLAHRHNTQQIEDRMMIDSLCSSLLSNSSDSDATLDLLFPKRLSNEDREAERLLIELGYGLE